ncbi:MAG: hypothetical protein OCC49_07700 [Fibrobacterales bacterium]
MRIMIIVALVSVSLWSFNPEEFCSGIYNCIAIQPVECSDSLIVKNEDIEYDSTFCSIYQEVQSRELEPDRPETRELYSNLGIEHRVTYIVEGDLPISKKMLDFLLSDIPHTALLINAYQETEYDARYTTLDHKTFHGTNGGSLKGTISELADNPSKREITYFGYGVTEVLFWSLRGTVLFFFEYQETANKEVHYALTVTVFNRSSIINGIMDLGMFRSVVNSKIEKIINHIKDSAHEYATGNIGSIDEYDKLKTELAQEFLRKLRMVDDTVVAPEESLSSKEEGDSFIVETVDQMVPNRIRLENPSDTSVPVVAPR